MYELSPALRSKRVLVAGGGVAGMEAARVAAIRGHKVTLYEKRKALGGHLIEASIPDFKKDIGRLLNWYKVQLKNLGIEIRFSTEVTPELIERDHPDEIFVATGSNPIIPDVQGIERRNVVTAIDLLLEKKAGGSVVVIGGGLIGCETAFWLAEQGKKVTVVEMLPEVMTTGIRVPDENRIMLLDLLAVNNVDIVTNTVVQEVTAAAVSVIDKTSRRRMIKAETVVLAVGLKANNKLCKSLRGKVSDWHALGDCREPRNIMGAIWDGYEVARMI
ncbi:MAG: NAD(P)/FAD-dependent oxidoreductase [Chloroflexota bacterium]